MKFLSPLFAARATDSTSNTIRNARRRLVLLYAGMTGLIVLFFSIMTIFAVGERMHDQSISDTNEIQLTTEAARELAQHAYPTKKIIQTKFEMRERNLFYEVYFEDTEVYVDLATGEVFNNEPPHPFAVGILYDELPELIGWIALLVFALSLSASIFVANKTLEPVLESSQKQKRFIADAAHELRNPLAALKTTIDSYTRSQTSTPELSMAVAIDLQHEVDRLIATSNALLALEQAQQPSVPKKCVVRDHIVTTIERLTPLLSEKNIALSETCDQETLLINPASLDSILYNLLHNAVKFSHTGDQIAVQWLNHTLTVRDTGIGIDQKHLPMIFERFYKADNSRNFNQSGSGLGLALVKELVTSSHGAIDIASSVETGTTVTVHWRS